MVKKSTKSTKKAVAGTPGDPVDHSVSASEIAGQVDPSKKSGAAVSAKSMDAVTDKTEDKADDNSLDAKVARSGLVFVHDHSTGEDYVGASPQNNPDATEASKLRSSVSPLSIVAPRTGMIVRPPKGDAFTIGEGFGPDATPGDWAKVTSPDGKALFS